MTNILLAQNNFVRKFIKDTRSAQNYIVPVSAALFVASRIAVAKYSWEKAKHSPNEKFRRDEFYKTTFREMAGWVASYLLLIIAKNNIERGMDNIFGISKWKIKNIISKDGKPLPHLKEFLELNTLAGVSEFKNKTHFKNDLMDLFHKNVGSITIARGKKKIFGLFNNSAYQEKVIDSNSAFKIPEPLKRLDKKVYTSSVLGGFLITLIISGYLLEAIITQSTK